MLKLALFVMAALLWTSAVFGSSKTYRQMTSDFFIEKNEEIVLSSNHATGVASSCRESIREAMCLVDPLPASGAPGEGNELGKDRPCLRGGEAYAAYFETLHDQYPPALQKIFCSIKKIYIEKDFFGTAYGGLIVDPSGKPIGAKVGIRKSLLDTPISLAVWASWKEQLSFGGTTGSYDLIGGLPLIQVSSSSRVSYFLYFVIAHEIGHIFDFSNELNRYDSTGCAESNPSSECKMHPQSWGALSWLTDQTPLPENDFPRRKELCFYWCDGKPLARSEVPSIYEGLERSSFISIYSTTQPWDDFADSLAYTLLDDNLSAHYFLDTAQGRTYDILSKLHSERFAKKREYIHDFLERGDIRYP